jgi:hypothetical protein
MKELLVKLVEIISGSTMEMNPLQIQGHKPPKLSIAMLCGSGSVKHDTMNSLIMSMQHLMANKIEHDYITLQGVTGIDSARNILTEIFMQNGHSHMLLIDDDMAWAADLPYRLMQENLDIVGVPYKRKNSKNCRWTVNHPVPDVALMEGKPYLMRVDSLGCGMMMIKRGVFEKLEPHVEKAIVSEERPPISLYFRHTIDKNGKLKSEDFSFCELARLHGINVWAWVDEEIAHIGNYAYTGRYSDNLGEGFWFEGPRMPLRIMLE